MHRRSRIAVLLTATTLALVAGAAQAAVPFDPFGDRDPTPCDPDVVGTDNAEQLTGGTKQDPAMGTIGQGVLGLGGNDVLIASADVPLASCVRGGNGDDQLRGGPGGDRLKGDNGNDRIDGAGGIDVVEGGDGADRLTGGPGNDWIDGDAGPDVIRAGAGNDSITGGAERNDIDAGPGNDRVSTANGIAERVRCGSGTDQIWADRADRLVGCERVHRIGTLYPAVSPGTGGPKAIFRTSLKAPFTTEASIGSAAYLYDIPIHPKGTGCARMTLPTGQDARGGERLVVPIRSLRHGGFCRGLYRGTIVFRSSDTNDNCPTQREARLANRRLDDCDVYIVLGRFSFRVH
jgi:hypothetical protein